MGSRTLLVEFCKGQRDFKDPRAVPRNTSIELSMPTML